MEVLACFRFGFFGGWGIPLGRPQFGFPKKKIKKNKKLQKSQKLNSRKINLITNTYNADKSKKIANSQNDILITKTLNPANFL